MENHPFGHPSRTTHHRHHQRNDDDFEEDRRVNYPPPPDTSFPSFDQPPPPPRPFIREDEFTPPATSFPSFDQPPPPPRPFIREDEFAPPPPNPSRFHQESGYPAPPPPKPYYQEPEFAPPTHQTQVFHTSHNSDSSFGYQPPPQSSTHVVHVSHEMPDQSESHHSFKPHLPSFLPHHSSASGSELDLSNKPSYKVYCKAEPDYRLTVRDGKVILARSDPSDIFQNWYKDEKYSTRVKDEEGFPCFALVNKATGQAMKHSVGEAHPVQLVPYNPNTLDGSILWTEAKDLGDGYRTVRMVNNIRLNLDAFHGDKKSGGVHDGTTIVLWKWNKGDNQRWRITP